MKLARDVIFDYLRDLQIEYLFGVPGTNEIPLIDGSSVPENQVTYVPCLHENIAMGAAMGYARMTGKPGIVQLHVTPGVGHSLGNLFNAHKSHVPMVILCGQQHSDLMLQEPLLASETIQVAKQYCKWVYEFRSSSEFPLVLQRAFKVAMTPPMGPVFLSIPWEFLLQPVTHPGPGKVTRIAPNFTGDRAAVDRAAALLAQAQNPMIVAGDGVGYGTAWDELTELANLLGAKVYTEGLSSMMNYPNHLPHWQGELPGFQEKMQQAFVGHDVALLCGFNAQAQLVIFDYEKGPLIPESVRQIYLHDDPWEIGKNHYGEVGILGSIKETLRLISSQVRANQQYDASKAVARNLELSYLSQTRDQLFNQHVGAFAQVSAAAMTEVPATSTYIQGALVAHTLAKLQDEMESPLVYVHEAISDSSYFQKFLRFEEPTSYYATEGGSLGYSMPASLGIKLAVGKRATVVNAVGDGSALFYPQVWWTAAKFKLPVLYLIMNNREYKTLLVGLQELTNLYGWKPSGPPSYLYLDEPKLSFVQIASSFGVEGALVSDPNQLEEAMRQGLAVVQAGRPYVLEILTDPALPAAQTPAPRLDIFQAVKEERS